MKHLLLIPVMAAGLMLSACGSGRDEPVEASPAPEQTSAAHGSAVGPMMPADAPPQEEVDPAIAPAPHPAASRACRDEIGEAAAARLVERCRAVSPATRPPCNVANPCAMVRGEIERACALFAQGERPAQCADQDP